MNIEDQIELIIKTYDSLAFSKISQQKKEKFKNLVLAIINKSKCFEAFYFGSHTGRVSYDNTHAGLGKLKYFKLIKIALENKWEDVLCCMLRKNNQLGQLYFFNDGGYRTTILHECAMLKMEKFCLYALEINSKFAEIEDEFGNTFIRCAKISGLEKVVKNAAKINPVYGLSAENKYIITNWKRKNKRCKNVSQKSI